MKIGMLVKYKILCLLLIGCCPLQYSCDLFRFGEEMIGANKLQLPPAL